MKNTALTKDDLLARPRIWPSVAGVGGVFAALVLLSQIWSAVQGSRLVNSWTVTVAAAVALAVAWGYRKPLTRWLVSLPFSIAILGAILAVTAIGTVVLQGLPPEEFVSKYGPGTGRFLHLAGVDDVFHSFPFRGLLGLLALSLALILVEKRAWRSSEWFFLLNHGGVIVILVGGLAGAYGGMKGFIDIHQGQVAKSFVLNDRFGKKTSEEVPLAFGLKLDKFEVERKAPEYRLYVYEGHKESGMPTLSRGLKESMDWTEAGASGKSFRLVSAYPDFELKTGLREVAEGKGVPAAQIRAYDKDGDIREFVLLAGQEGRDGVFFSESRTLLRFYWQESDVKLQTGMKPARHLLSYKFAGGATPEEIEVKVGEELELPLGARMTVTAFYPDFGYDGKKKLGYSRTQEPKNPTIELSLSYPTGATERRWVFANRPDFNTGSTAEGQAYAFNYKYEPEQSPAEREIAIIGSTKEVLDYRHGELKDRRPAPEKPTELLLRTFAAMLLQVSASAEEVRTPTTRSDEWRRPVAEVELRLGGETDKVFLKAGVPVELGPDGSMLVFQAKPDDIKAFRSQVSVITADGAMLQDTIAVNHPLSYGGYRFYQSNYRREDPTYSGILVVKDPGLWVAYLGFVMMCLGVILRFYLTPWIQKRRQRAVRGAI